jgi:Family of unknown function (DUF6152)
MSHRAAAIRVVFGLALVLPASAHHSHGHYQQYFIDLRGSVTDVQFINPHSWVYLDVTDEKGAAISWALEATGIGGLTRLGIARGYVKAGDTIKVRCHPARDGSEGCLLGFVQAADGSIKDWDGGQALPVDDGFFDLNQ